MHTRLSQFCTHVIEGCWLTAFVAAPLFFNVHSSRIFEPDKVGVLRAIGLIMALAWIVKGLENRPPRRGGAAGRMLRGLSTTVPVLPLALLLFLDQAFAAAVSVAPRVSFWGSYTRLQGLYTTGVYIGLFLSLLALLRTRDQLERLITAALVAALPVSLYGIIQYFGTDPLPWASDVTRRVASSMGNPIFVAAFLILTVPLTLYRLFESGSAAAGDEGAGTKRVLVLGSLLSLFAQMTAWQSGPRAGTASAVLTVGTWIALAVLLRRPLAPFLRIGTYTVLLSAQLMCILFSQSRGPWLGLVVGLFLLALLWTLAQRRRKQAWLVAGSGLATLLFLVALNLSASPPAFVRDVPYVGRLGQLLETGSGSGRVRVLIWEGVERLAAADPLRTAVGYGPETLALVYPPHYPPALSRAERYDALPDRAHNETFDALISTGLVGLAIYLLFLTALFTCGLTGAGVLRTPHQRYAFLGLWTAGGAGAVLLAVLLDGSWRFAGISLPAGMLGGLFVYLAGYGLIVKQAPDAAPADRPLRLIAATLLAAVAAHVVELHVGIAVTATRTYFWAYAGLLVVCGALYLRRPGLLNETTAAPRPGRLVHPTWNPALIASSLVAAFVLVTMVYAFLSARPGAAQLRTIVWLLAFTWATAGIVVVTETWPRGRSMQHPRLWAKAVGLYLVVTLAVTLPFAAAQVGVLRFGTDPGRVILPYFGAVLLLIAAVARALLPKGPASARSRTPGFVVLVLAVGALALAVETSVHGVRADMAVKQASTHLAQGNPEQAVALYRRALALEPAQDVYHLHLGKALLQRARQESDPDSLLREAERVLLHARVLSPLNPDHTANLARLYRGWARLAEAGPERTERFRQSLALFEKATLLSPNTAYLWNDWATTSLMAGDAPRARRLYEHALTLDDAFYPTYVLLGDLYRTQHNWATAAQAYEKALSLAPGLLQVRLSLAFVQAQQERRAATTPGPDE